MDEFTQGESIGREMTLSVGGVVQDTNDFLTIVVVVRQENRGSDGGTYSLAGSTLVRQDPTSDGKIFFDVPPATSTDLSEGNYNYQVTTTETDGDYDSSTRTRIFIGECFKLNRKLA